MVAVIFITGTDTGAGKTILTALICERLQQCGTRVFAWKPFSSGGREDAALLRSILSTGSQGGVEIGINKVNPFAFRSGVTPLLAARQEGFVVRQQDVTTQLNRIRSETEVVLVEGAGGLLSPLGEGFSALELICEWKCPVLIAARNRLGVINQVRLTVAALHSAGVSRMALALSDEESEDASSTSNASLIRECLPQLPQVTIPYLGGNLTTAELIRQNVSRLTLPLQTLIGALLDPT